jgi:CYTH domain-containing protein
MVYEIERKFLLKKVPINIDWDFIYDIKEYYVSDYRIRIQTNKKTDEIKWYYTQKTATDDPMVYKENEKEITYDDFWKYISNRESKINNKTRYVKYFGDDELKVEVDDFNGMKLVVAEVEIPSVDFQFELPKYIKDNLILEVTRYAEFKNKRLAV